jgi:DNA-binding transcriptional LysR family regulator
MNSGMELKHLTAFLTVADELHFGRAAERLGIAQPQLSQWIRRLEADLGAVLFDRSTRTVRLTEQGQAVLGPARETLKQAHLVERAALLGHAGVVGQVRIGYAGASSRGVIPPLARVVRTEEPGIELDLRSMVYSGFVPSLVASGQLDMGFSRLPVANSDVHARTFSYERLLAALPEDHPLAATERVEIKDLAAEPFVTFPATRGSAVRDACMLLAREAGFSPRILQEAPDSYAILGLVAAGVGVTLTVSSVRHIDTPGLVFRELAGEPAYLAAVVVWPKHHAGSATLRVLEILERLMPTPAECPGRVLP